MDLAFAWTFAAYVVLASVWAATWCLLRVVGSETHGPSLRLGIGAAAVAGAGLVVLGFLYQSHALAERDADLLRALSDARGSALVETFRVVTTIGDAVPSLAIAVLLAVWLLRVAGTGFWPLILPALMCLQLLLQFSYSEIFPILTMTDVAPELTIDGSGSIPSGSVARLMSLFFASYLIYRRAVPGGGSWLPTLGAMLVVVEIFTRLYLGRHFLGDIVGGVLLGVLLSLLVAALMTAIGGIDRTRRSTRMSL